MWASVRCRKQTAGQEVVPVIIREELPRQVEQSLRLLLKADDGENSARVLAGQPLMDQQVKARDIHEPGLPQVPGHAGCRMRYFLRAGKYTGQRVEADLAARGEDRRDTGVRDSEDHDGCALLEVLDPKTPESRHSGPHREQRPGGTTQQSRTPSVRAESAHSRDRSSLPALVTHLARTAPRRERRAALLLAGSLAAGAVPQFVVYLLAGTVLRGALALPGVLTR